MATLPQLIEEDLLRLDGELRELLEKSDATTALIIDKGGFLITAQGDTRQFDLTTIAALAAGAYMANQTIAGLVHETNFNSIYQQGEKFSMFVMCVDENCLLVVIFKAQVSVGAVKNPAPGALPTPLTVGNLLAIPMPNGFYAAVWVLSLGEPYRDFRGKLVKGSVYFVVLEGHWQALPTAAHLEKAGFAKSEGSHHATDDWKGCFWGAIPADFVVTGTKAPTKAALALVAEGSGTMVFQNAEHLRSELFKDWRLEHDRAAVEEEWRLAESARALRIAERKAKLTLPEMLKEKPFAHWREHWPPAVVRRARAIFSEATNALIELDGGTKRQKKAILKGITTQLNALYDETGCIETGEASEVIARVEQLATLVGLSNDDEALTGHRDW